MQTLQQTQRPKEKKIDNLLRGGKIDVDIKTLKSKKAEKKTKEQK